ncbi:MAG: OmpA family protein [Chitinophagales bacterium]|nr:OmpA family protein [Chitinophagales bacterium]MDW8428275.1 OmpA family protein [Chitinophagales bacterium]
MKRTLLPITAVFLFSAFKLSGQNERARWLVGAGINAIDFHAVNGGGLLQTENWNVTPAISHLTLGRHLNHFLATDLQLGLARTETNADGNNISGEGFFNVDLNLRFKLDNGVMLKEDCKIGPYLFAGLGASQLSGDQLRPNLNGGLGLNLWLWRDLGVYAQTAYNWATENEGKSMSFMQHSAGMVVRFGMKDSDGDGITDKEDACPDQAGPESTMGCPDSDGDQIADRSDACPTAAGLKELDGCPDADKDGIADKDDECPNAAGAKALKGCPDRDGDGIADKNDACPDVKGLAAFRGCPDTDGDGLTDAEDKCPTRRGALALKGCPDQDNDGVADDDDRCPTEPGPATNAGCPVPKQEEMEKLTVAARAINFETGSDKIRPASFKVLDEIVDIMNRYPHTKWSIEGHTDNVGDDARNMDLSTRRAAAVKNYFISKGISADRLQSAGFGETRPIADNKTAEGRAQNRRTEIKLIEQPVGK